MTDKMPPMPEPSVNARTVKELGPPVCEIQSAMQAFARAHSLLGCVSDRAPADKALCDAIQAYARTHAAAVAAPLLKALQEIQHGAMSEPIYRIARAALAAYKEQQ